MRFDAGADPSIDVGHLPLTLAEGTADVRPFGPVDRTECNNERVLAQRGGEPNQLLDERAQGYAHTELEISVRMSTNGNMDNPNWGS